MTLWPKLRSLCRNLLRRGEADADLDREIRSYVDLLTEEKTANGVSSGEAQRAALGELGGIDQVKERVRDTRVGHVIETIWQDLCLGARMLQRSPMFAVVAVTTLTVSIGANSAIFSVINAILIRPLPFRDPGSLVRIYDVVRGNVDQVTSWRDLHRWREQSHVFEGLAGFSQDSDTFLGANGPEVISTADAGEGFFQIFRINPVLGRLFNTDEYRNNSIRAVLLSEGFWKSRFSADPALTGKSINLNGYQVIVVGIVPDGFDQLFGRPVQLWWPYHPDENSPWHYVPVLGRLKPGISLAEANKDMELVSSRMQQLYPEDDAHRTAIVLTLQDSIVGDVRLILLVFLGAVGLVLLVACVNVANLLLARGATREREMAIRSALGAGPARLIRQLFTESLLLSTLGSGFGILLGWVATKSLVALAPRATPRLDQVRLDGRVVGFTILLSLGTAILFALVPAVRIGGAGPNEAIKETGRSATSGRRHGRLRALLIVCEIAISLVLLIGCGLLMKSFYLIRSVDPGFNPNSLWTAQIPLLESRYHTRESRNAIYDQVLAKIGSLSGARSAAVCAGLPLNGGGAGSWPDVLQEGRNDWDNAYSVQYRLVGPGYWHTMQIPLIAGRDFTQFDGRNDNRVVVLSQSAARKLYPDQDPIGRRVMISAITQDNLLYQILGVAGDVKREGLDTPDDMAVYVPFAQDPFPLLIIVARGDSDDASVGPAIKSLIRSIDKDLPIENVRSMDEIRGNTLAGRRFNLLLIAAFASLATILAGIGTYGVISYSVAERTHEIGIRMALGAARRKISLLIVGDAARLALMGASVGVALSFAFTRITQSLLFKVSPTDSLTFIAVPVFLVALSLLAAYLPARRAMKIDPLTALRYE